MVRITGCCTSLSLAFVLSLARVVWADTAVSAHGHTHHVPRDYSSIQAAIDAAQDGDRVLVAPGVYHESLKMSGKSIQLCSHYSKSPEPRFIRQTVLDGSLPRDETLEDEDRRQDQVIMVAPDAGPGTLIQGFTIRDGDDGIACYAKISICNNRFVNNVDGIDYEGGGGECRDNEFVANDDDGVDLDLDCEATIVDNVIRDNDDDGIEIRLHEYAGPTLKIVIFRNTITGNGENGIQIIDYPDLSDRHMRIERNLIANNAMAGIGCMSNGNTVEDYEAAQIPEPMEIINNTIATGEYGMTGGGNAALLNNLFVSNLQTALKKVAGASEIAHCLLWDNGRDLSSCNTPQALISNQNPQLNESYLPLDGSPCIGAGVVDYTLHDGKKVEVNPEAYNGKAPSLGAFEHQE